MKNIVGIILLLIILILSGLFVSIEEKPEGSFATKDIQHPNEPNKNIYSKAVNELELAMRFDFPVGWPDGKGYHDLQSFQENNHLGEDWNDLGGCNNDRGGYSTTTAGFISPTQFIKSHRTIESN